MEFAHRHPQLLGSVPGCRDRRDPIDERALWAAQRQSAGTAYYSTSINDGESWSDSQPLGFFADCPYLLRHTTSDGGNIILMAYRGLTGSGQMYTALRYSLDECATWSDAITVDGAAAWSYPSMVNLSDGSVLIAYADNGDIFTRQIAITGPAGAGQLRAVGHRPCSACSAMLGGNEILGRK